MSGAINYVNNIPATLVSKVVPASGPVGIQTQSNPQFWRAQEYRPATIRQKRTSSGWRAPTSFSHTFMYYKNPEVDCAAHDSSGNAYTLVGGPMVVTSTRANAFIGAINLTKQVDAAISQALLKLSGMPTDFGQNFAEREQADRMIGGKVDKYTSQLTGRYISRHRRDWREVKRVSPLVRHGMKFPESWLEFQYGALPLLSDIYGAYQVLKEVDSDAKPMRSCVKGFARADQFVGTASGDIGGSYGLHPYHFVIHGTADGFAFVRLDYALVNPRLAQLQQVGVVNPVLLAWNLLPYSFVVDWALPVSNYLQACTATLGWQFIGGSITTVKRSRSVGLTLTEVENPGLTYDGRNVSGDCEFRGLDFERTALTSSPAPRVPHFKNPLTLGHTANALSLLAVALKS